MKLQNNQEITKTPHQRLSEIGKILANGICRLHNKKSPKIKDKELDYNFSPSVHGVSNNLNSRAL